MAELDDQDSLHGSGATDPVDMSMMDELLQDPQRKEIVLKNLGLGDDSSKLETNAPASKGNGKGNGSSGSGSPDQHLTPSGKAASGWTTPPFCGWLDTPWFPGMVPPDPARAHLLALWRFYTDRTGTRK